MHSGLACNVGRVVLANDNRCIESCAAWLRGSPPHKKVVDAQDRCPTQECTLLIHAEGILGPFQIRAGKGTGTSVQYSDHKMCCFLSYVVFVVFCLLPLLPVSTCMALYLAFLHGAFGSCPSLHCATSGLCVPLDKRQDGKWGRQQRKLKRLWAGVHGHAAARKGGGVAIERCQRITVCCSGRRPPRVMLMPPVPCVLWNIAAAPLLQAQPRAGAQLSSACRDSNTPCVHGYVTILCTSVRGQG